MAIPVIINDVNLFSLANFKILSLALSIIVASASDKLELASTSPSKLISSLGTCSVSTSDVGVNS